MRYGIVRTTMADVNFADAAEGKDLPGQWEQPRRSESTDTWPISPAIR